MAVDPTKLTSLLARLREGKPNLAQYLKVEWAEGLTEYYAYAPYSRIPPFTGVKTYTGGEHIQARLLGDAADPFKQFEIQPDLRTQEIEFAFDDIDKAISGRFKTYGTVKCTLYDYYPEDDINRVAWGPGQLRPPKIYGYRTVRTFASNGARSRELKRPGRRPGRECSFTYGGHFTTLAAQRSGGCPVDLHLGGTIGEIDPLTGLMYTHCPRLTAADCDLHTGTTDGRYFGGSTLTPVSYLSDGRSGFIANPKGNNAIKKAIQVIAGRKHVGSLNLLAMTKEPNASHPDEGFIRSLWEYGEGPNVGVTGIKVNDKAPNLNQWAVRLGEIGQSAVMAGIPQQLSGTGVFFALLGLGNPATIAPQSLHAECDVVGFKQVNIYDTVAAGNGLLGVYHLGSTFDAEIGRRFDANVNDATTTTPPFGGMPATGWCRRQTGRIKPRHTEAITFYGSHDDDMKLIVNGVTIFDATGPSTTTNGVTAVLTADTEYTIQVDFKQGTSPGLHPWRCILEWESASQAREVVPTTRLFHDGGQSHIQNWTDDRVWWLLEMHTNQKFGIGYPAEEFWIDDSIARSAWGRKTVTFTHVFPDGEEADYTYRRTSLNVVLTERAFDEQIADICRAGRLFVPFQYEGKYALEAAREFTAGELAAAVVFTDTGTGKNIETRAGLPNIDFSQVPDDELINRVKVVFEEGSNKDLSRPIICDDPDQQLRAGRARGVDNLLEVPLEIAAFGSNDLREALRFGYSVLWFGQMDEGGIKNNLRGTFVVPYEWTHAVKRYGVCKIVSDLLDGFLTPEGDPFEYFRILYMYKIGNGLARMIVQGYNPAAMAAFEVESADPPVVIGGQPGGGTIYPPICVPTIGAADVTGKFLNVPIVPC